MNKRRPCISTHTPLAGRDRLFECWRVGKENFYSHAPRGARLHFQLLFRVLGISTHTPLAGRDRPGQCGEVERGDFYSHAPRGARHLQIANTGFFLQISTHTPLAGRDPRRNVIWFINRYFYSHAPRGARQRLTVVCTHFDKFLLTRPSRGATLPRPFLALPCPISTHTPLAGRDSIAVSGRTK